MRAAIAAEGCFVITGLFDPAAIARIRARADFVGRAWDYMIEHGYTTDIKPYLEGVFRAGHLPETHIDAGQTWAELTSASRFDEIATAVFGATTRGYALRRTWLNGALQFIPYHQDAFFIGQEPWYNFWTPLQDCGADAPGLEVVRRSGPPIIKQIKERGQHLLAHVERTYDPDAHWVPELRAGDVLVFTSMMFHRTQFGPNMSKMRLSLELRGAITDRTLPIAGVPSQWSEIQMVESAHDGLVSSVS